MKIYCKATIQNLRDWTRGGIIDQWNNQWNKIDSRSRPTYIRTATFQQRCEDNSVEKKMIFSANGAEIVVYSYASKILNSYLASYAKIHVSWT